MTDEPLPSPAPEVPGPSPSAAAPAPASGAGAGPTSTGRWPHRRRSPGLTSISGEDLSRIVALSDGVFAFAMTLLVLSLTVPSFPGLAMGAHPSEGMLAHRLLDDWPVFLGYAFAFVMISIWWIVHNRTYQYIAKFDQGLVWLNLVLLLQIALMPFVLSVYTTYSSYQVAIDLFAAIQVTLGLTTTGIWVYAQRNGLTKPGVPPAAARYFTRRGYYSAVMFAISIAISFVSVEAAEISWAGVFFLQRALTLEGD